MDCSEIEDDFCVQFTIGGCSVLCVCRDTISASHVNAHVYVCTYVTEDDCCTFGSPSYFLACGM